MRMSIVDSFPSVSYLIGSRLENNLILILVFNKLGYKNLINVFTKIYFT